LASFGGPKVPNIVILISKLGEKAISGNIFYFHAHLVGQKLLFWSKTGQFLTGLCGF